MAAGTMKMLASVPKSPPFSQAGPGNGPARQIPSRSATAPAASSSDAIGYAAPGQPRNQLLFQLSVFRPLIADFLLPNLISILRSETSPLRTRRSTADPLELWPNRPASIRDIEGVVDEPHPTPSAFEAPGVSRRLRSGVCLFLGRVTDPR